ncbi:MAG TPA: hypothetical protein ENN34_03335 [Deltaproteobacteria bacterium]|nr:hypothetical protein [Deltaproteobacteria bacterium]
MRYYRTSILIGIISALILGSSFSYYRFTEIETNYNRSKLQTILAMAEDRKVYAEKIDAIKEYSSRLFAISHDHETNVDYEIVLSDHDISRLYSQIRSTYAQGLFFLEQATIESTPSGISLSVKGFKLGDQAP